MSSFLRLIKTIRDKYGLGFWYWKTTPSNLRQTSIFLINRPAGNPSSRVALARGKTREQTGFRLETSKSVTPAINRLRTTQETRKMNWNRSSFIIFFLNVFLILSGRKNLFPMPWICMSHFVGYAPRLHTYFRASTTCPSKSRFVIVDLLKIYIPIEMTKNVDLTSFTENC